MMERQEICYLLNIIFLSFGKIARHTKTPLELKIESTFSKFLWTFKLSYYWSLTKIYYHIDCIDVQCVYQYEVSWIEQLREFWGKEEKV